MAWKRGGAVQFPPLFHSILHFTICIIEEDIMGGFFGAVSHEDVTLDIFFGVDYHSHLGTRRGGMLIHDQEDGFQRQIHSIENTPFRTKFERILPTFTDAAASAASATPIPSLCWSDPTWGCTPSPRWASSTIRRS